MTISKTRTHIAVSNDTKILLTHRCREEFLRHHPEFTGMKLSHNFLLRKVCDFYLMNE